MDETLRRFYKTEYEATPGLTIQALCAKYSISAKELGDTSSWKKATGLPQARPILGKQDECQPYHRVSTPTQYSRYSAPQACDGDIQDNIYEYKKLAVAEAITRLRLEGSDMPVKEFKDLTSVVDMIERSFKGTQDGNQTNVLIQNIINNFKDDI